MRKECMKGVKQLDLKESIINYTENKNTRMHERHMTVFNVSTIMILDFDDCVTLYP